MVANAAHTKKKKRVRKLRGGKVSTKKVKKTKDKMKDTTGELSTSVPMVAKVKKRLRIKGKTGPAAEAARAMEEEEDDQ